MTTAKVEVPNHGYTVGNKITLGNFYKPQRWLLRLYMWIGSTRFLKVWVKSYDDGVYKMTTSFIDETTPKYTVVSATKDSIEVEAKQ